MLKRAYELEPHNPSVLNHLATHFFYKGQYTKALTLAQRAHDHSDGLKAIRAESSYHMARCYHAQGDYASALHHYTDAHRANPDYAAPQFGLGQMHLANKDPKKAAACFERVLKVSPANVEVLKVLGHLYGRDGRDAEALKLLNTAIEHEPADPSIWLELGKLQQRMPGQLAAALKAYEKAAGLIKKVRTVPAEIWNNLGAIRHRLGKLDTAEQAYGYALRVLALGGSGDEYDPECISTQYNLGRLYEDRQEIDKAVDKYKAILQRYPNYPGAFLRLAACEEAAGRPHAAIGWANKALMLHPRSADAYCVLGNLFLATGDLKKAEGTFRQVLALEGCENDSYATNQLAWIQIKLATQSGVPSESSPLSAACASKKGEERVDNAVEMLRQVLETEPNNLYAANGIGIVFIAKGRLHEAKQVFTQVREASAACEHATINLAQLDAALGEHATAAALYEGATKKVKGTKQSQLRLLQARSHFDGGEFLECRRVLQTLVCDQPELQVAWHNLGLAYLAAAEHPKASAHRGGGGVPPPRPVAAVAAAQRELAHACCIFAKGDVDVVQLADAATVADTNDADDDKAALAERAAKAAVAAGLVGGASEISKAAAAAGLSEEHRKRALKACEQLTHELQDEAERAAEAEVRFQQEQAVAEATAAEFAAAREKLAAEEAARVADEEEKHAARIAAQKAKLAEKLQAWREADAKEAEAAASGVRAKRRRRDTDADGSDDDAAILRAAREDLAEAADAKSSSESEPDAAEDDEDDDDLFGSGDETSSDDEDGKEGGDEDGDDEAKAAAKSAKAAKKQARKEKKERKAAKAARKAEKAERKAKKDARKAAIEAVRAKAVGGDQGGDADPDDDLFGSDDDAGPAAAAEASASGGGRLAKRRKIADAEAQAMDDAEEDLFGDDDDDSGKAAGAATVNDDAAADEDAPDRPRKRKTVIDDDDD